MFTTDMVFFIIELIAVTIVSLVFIALGIYLGRKRRYIYIPAAVIGIFFLCIKSIALWVPIYDFFPRLGGNVMDIIQASGSLILGIAFCHTRKLPRQRILYSVLVVLFIFIVFCDRVYLLFEGEQIAQLKGNKEKGIYRQSLSFTCYPACVCTLLSYWGIYTTEGEVAFLARTTFRGTDPYRIIYAIECLGEKKKLKARLANINLADLTKLSVPCLLSVDYEGNGHAVVFLGLNSDKRIVIGDPLSGIKILDLNEMKSIYKWKGLAIIVKNDL